MILKFDTEVFPIFSTLMAYTLPHSSGCGERIFSAINFNTIKIINKVDTETLSGVFHTKRF